jgi:hypothetical protein
MYRNSELRASNRVSVVADHVAAPQSCRLVVRAFEALKAQSAKKRPLFGELQPARPIYGMGDGFCLRDTPLHALAIVDCDAHTQSAHRQMIARRGR